MSSRVALATSERDLRFVRRAGDRLGPAHARDHADFLTALHERFTRIAVTRAPDEVVAHMLRAAYEPLGFSRAIYFDVAHDGNVNARFQVDGSDVVEPAADVPETSPGSAMRGS